VNLAYQMLGDVGEAEDVAQEAFLRLARADVTQIDDVRGWLVVVVSRLCLDHLRSARVRRETTGPWLPEPVIDGVDPADRVTLDESVRMALLIVLEELSPAERAAFVLHDVFQLPFEEVGDIVGRSPAAVRKLASRARVHIREHGDTARFTVDVAEQTRVAEKFIAAASGGNLEALLAVLDPDVEGVADLGDLPAPPGFPSTVRGRDVIAPRLIALYANDRIKLACLPVNGEPAVVASVGDHLLAVVILTTRAGLVTEIHAIVDPHKLAHLQGASLAGPHPAAEEG